MKKIHPTELAECRKCACFSIRKAARAITRIYDAALEEVDLRGTQFTLLAVTRNWGEVSVSHAAEMMSMDRTTLTRNLKPLVDRGLLIVKQGEDKRTKTIAVTHEGQDLLERAMPLWQQIQWQVVDRFGESRFESLLTDLTEIVEAGKS